MHFWFQNLNDSGNRAFYFRGSVSVKRRLGIHYEFASGPALKVQYQHGEAGDAGASSQLTLGLLFFTVYLTFPLPESWYFQKKCVATWKNPPEEFYLIDGRVYGFYVYQWAIVWSWHQKVHESSSREPWYRHFYFHVDDFFLGKMELTQDVELVSSENVRFKIGEKEFVMDSIKWIKRSRFRRYIPYSLWNQKWISVEMKIDKPPMRAGKGENSWDLDDDGSFGLYMSWEHERPTYQNREAMNRLAIGEYVRSAKKDAKKYGSGSSERSIRADDLFEYLGTLPAPSSGANSAEAVPSV